jgi:hypothetical protein
MTKKINDFLNAQRHGEMRVVQFFNFNRAQLTCGLSIESEDNTPRVRYSVSGDGSGVEEAFDNAMKEAKGKFGGKI